MCTFFIYFFFDTTTRFITIIIRVIVAFLNIPTYRVGRETNLASCSHGFIDKDILYFILFFNVYKKKYISKRDTCFVRDRGTAIKIADPVSAASVRFALNNRQICELKKISDYLQ